MCLLQLDNTRVITGERVHARLPFRVRRRTYVRDGGFTLYTLMSALNHTWSRLFRAGTDIELMGIDPISGTLDFVVPECATRRHSALASAPEMRRTPSSLAPGGLL